jgi:molecular chaperone HtpG
MGRMDEGGSKRVLELNPNHAAIVALRNLHAKSPDDLRIEGSARLLLDQAAIAEGSKLKDPSAFARRVNELLVKDLA